MQSTPIEISTFIKLHRRELDRISSFETDLNYCKKMHLHFGSSYLQAVHPESEAPGRKYRRLTSGSQITEANHSQIFKDISPGSISACASI